MFSFVSGIITALSAADAEKSQSRALRRQGDTAAANANRQAAATMRTAAANWDIESSRRKDTRRKQTHAAAAARNRSALTGLTTQGTGSLRETLTNAEFDQILDNLNKSAAITYANYFNNANATRTQGILQKQAAYAEAQQHDIAAHAIRQSTAISATLGAAAAYIGYNSGVDAANTFNTENAAAISAGLINPLKPKALGVARASTYASDIFNNFQSFNPYTASLTRKNSWGSFAAIANGSTPGYNNSEYKI